MGVVKGHWKNSLKIGHVTNTYKRALHTAGTTTVSQCQGLGSSWVRLCGGHEHRVGVLEPGVPLQRTLDPFRLEVKRLLRSELFVNLAQHTAALLARLLADFVQVACVDP